MLSPTEGKSPPLAFHVASLWPAGHLSHRWGDQQLHMPRSFCNVDNWRKSGSRLISSLEGEMSGRTEGGAVPPASPDSGKQIHAA